MSVLAATRSGTVGAFNNADYYSFTVTSTQTVTLDLASVYGDPELLLYDASGNQIDYDFTPTYDSVVADATIVETLAAGTYYAEVYDSSTSPYTLNVYSGSPAVGDGSTDTGGSTLASATALGMLSTTPDVYAGYIGGGYTADYYSFTVGSISNVNVELSGLQNTAYVYLLDASGDQLASFYGSSTSLVNMNDILPVLAAGTYYVEVVAGNNYYPTGYNLSVDATPIDEGTNQSIATAKSMGTLSAIAVSDSGEVNPTNTSNYYSFSVGSTSRVSLLLSGVTATADLELYNAAGTGIGYSTSATTTSNGSILYNLDPLAIGTYYVSVSDDYDATDYTLTASATALAVAGSSAATATRLTPTATPASVTDFVGDAYQSDYYTFTLTSATTVDLRLAASSGNVVGNAELTLSNSVGTTLTTVAAETSQDGLITDNLGAGTYYLDVSEYGWNTPFTLTYSTGAPTVGSAGGNHAGSTITTAENIGTLTSTAVSYADWVGTAHTDDYYEFTLSTASTVYFDVTGQTNYLLLELKNLSGTILYSASGNEVTDTSVVDQLAAGSYFIDVNNDGSSGTGFDLTVSAPPLPNTGGISLASADNIGALGTTTQTVTGYVGPLDNVDYVEFTLSSASTINATLSGLSNSGDTGLELLNVSGDELTASSGYAGNISLIYDLSAGTYFLEVDSNDSTNYSLAVNATPIADSAGSTLGTASPVGAVGSTVTLSGSSSQYTIADDNGSLYVADSVANRDGTQTLSGVTEMVFTDGVGIFDPTGTAEDVARIYLATLDRAPDVSGLEYWTAEVDDSNVPLSVVATEFTTSPEFIQDYGNLSNAAFVNQLYLNVLGRAADAAGAAYWEGVLNSGGSRGTVVLGFAESAEYETDTLSTAGDENNAEAYRLYQAALDRTPDATGLTYWASVLAGGETPVQVAQGFISSAEFQQDYGALDPTEFVTTLYSNVLHRAPDSGGLAYWVGQLDQGASQASVLVGFSDSLENRAQTASATHANWVFIPN